MVALAPMQVMDGGKRGQREKGKKERGEKRESCITCISTSQGWRKERMEVETDVGRE